MFNDAVRQSMKWLTEYSNCRAMIVSISKLRENVALLAQEMPADQAERRGPDRFNFTRRAKIVASRDEMIVEIISPLAFTFKIPFH
jgi:hypothetical protein